MMIEDLWPVCACAGASPQMLEHGRPICTKFPKVLEVAVDEDRDLTEEEWGALVEADRRRRIRGYSGPLLTRQVVDELVAEIRASKGASS